MTKQMVLADTPDGAVVIGPVFKQETVDALRELVEARGWENLGTARVLSKADFEGGAS